MVGVVGENRVMVGVVGENKVMVGVYVTVG